jgi:hypothetical protein
MMGRLNHDQEQFFYSFRLEDAVPEDHPVREIAAVLDLSLLHRNDIKLTRRGKSGAAELFSWERLRGRCGIRIQAIVNTKNRTIIGGHPFRQF